MVNRASLRLGVSAYILCVGHDEKVDLLLMKGSRLATSKNHCRFTCGFQSCEDVWLRWLLANDVVSDRKELAINIGVKFGQSELADTRRREGSRRVKITITNHEPRTIILDNNFFQDLSKKGGLCCSNGRQYHHQVGSHLYQQLYVAICTKRTTKGRNSS